MVWSAVGTAITPKVDWQYTEPITGDFFRFRHTKPPLKGLFQIAQAEIDNNVAILGEPTTLDTSVLADAIALPKPSYFTNRRLAIRRLLPEPSIESQLRDVLIDSAFKPRDPSIFLPSRSAWQIAIEVSDLLLPNAATTPVSIKPSTVCIITNINAAIASTQLLAASTSRKGAIIYNNSSSGLSIEFGAAATASSIPKLFSGGYYEVPFNFTGAINGIWESASTTSGAIIKEFT